MGIKMGAALDCAGAEWRADTYVKGRGKEPLKCVHCPAPIAHQSAHTRERDDKPILIPAYFRLLPAGRHAYGCKYGVEKEVGAIAKESEGLIESIRDGKYRLRLVMIHEALGGSTPRATNGDGRQISGASKTYERSRGNLPAYINSANRVLQLRALCDEDEEIAGHLELVFEGNTVVPWSQFYFETERYMSAFNAVFHNTVQHPIAINGTVESKRHVEGEYEPTNVLNLAKPKYLQNPDDAENGVGVEVNVWSKNADWLAGLDPGTEVVILGLWKAVPGQRTSANTAGKFRTFTTHKLSIRPILMIQIARVRKR